MKRWKKIGIYMMAGGVALLMLGASNINQPPCTPVSITGHTGNQTKCANSTATFSVSVSGTSPFTYQWRSNGVNLVNGGHISGAQSATLQLTTITSADAASYDVIVNNNCPSQAQSASATLTVVTQPFIVVQPQSTTNCQGATVQFSISASGTSVTYQWCKGTNNLTNGGNISGAQSSISATASPGEDLKFRTPTRARPAVVASPLRPRQHSDARLKNAVPCDAGRLF